MNLRLEWRLAALRNGFQDATAYRVEFLIEVLSAAMIPAAIQWVLWYALFKLGGATQVAGMSYEQMIHYTMVSLMFTQIRGGDLDFELSEMIRTGQLSNYLLRPVGVVEFVWIRGIAPKIFIAGVALAVGSVWGWMVGLSPAHMVAAMFMALIGNIIHYQISSSLAASAFLWEEGYSILMVKNMVVSFLSGELLPLNLFPEKLQWIWKATPFYLYVYGPTEYALGNWSTTYFLQQLTVSFVWLLIGWALIQLTWGTGIKRYSSLGN
jgi:ABC-2 type transport system permease protein